jgi:putative ABC transport system permease protein
MPPSIIHSLRALSRHRRFVALSIGSLGLAIALNTTMYSVLDALINPALAMRDHRNLYRISFYGDMRRLVPQEQKDQALAALPIVEDLAVHSWAYRDNMAERGRVYRLARVVNVSPNFFSMVGVRPRHGRLLSQADLDVQPQPIVVSEVFWRQFFPGRSWFDTATIRLDNVPRNIVGVLPFEADFPGDHTDIWQIPASAQLTRLQKSVLRVKAGVTKQQAETVLQDVARQLGALAQESPRDVAYRIKPAIGDPFRYQRFHLAMIGSVVAVLLVACVNLANLQIARGITRAREFATRAALGATRWALVRQMLLESAWFAAAGVVVALLLTFWGMNVIENRLTRSLADYVVRPQVSWRLFAFASGAALLSLRQHP